MAAEQRDSEIIMGLNDRNGVIARPEYADQVRSDWFSPEYWGDAASVVNSGGRGSAWFVQNGDEHWVLRHYRRGGMAASISERTYCYPGMWRTRSFEEFCLTNRMFLEGLPVPKPVAACYRYIKPCFYCASILVEQIQDAKPLSQYLESTSTALWERVGGTIRTFHNFGLYHADLNCDNILINSDGDVFLIDFDKSFIIEGPIPSNKTRQNINRLSRSVEKLAGESFPRRSWQALLDVYER